MSSTTYPLPGEPTVLILDGEQAPYHLEREAPKWSNEDAVNYEVARDVITALMAFRSEWIGLERAKPAPDLSAIERWKAERGAYAAELRGLHRGRLRKRKIKYVKPLAWPPLSQTIIFKKPP